MVDPSVDMRNGEECAFGVWNVMVAYRVFKTVAVAQFSIKFQQNKVPALDSACPTNLF